MIISIRAEYPATGKYKWDEALKQLDPISNIELAFHGPDNFVQFVEVEEVVIPIEDAKKRISTVHMAEASLTNLKLFMATLVKTLKIADAVNCQRIVLHPSNGNISDHLFVLEQVIFPILKDYGCFFLWETFPGKRRMLQAWDGLVQFCEQHPDRNKICYDICHMQRQNADEVIEDIDKYGLLIECYHCSNWVSLPALAQHLPIRSGVVDFDKVTKRILEEEDFSTYPRSLVATLEYMREFHDQLVPDAQHLLNLIYS